MLCMTFNLYDHDHVDEHGHVDDTNQGKLNTGN